MTQTVESSTVPHESRPPERRRRRRRILVAVGIALAVALVAAILTGVVLVGMAGELTRGRDALEDARGALSDGNLDQAADAFAAAQGHFQAALDRGHGTLGSVARGVPLVGNNTKVATALALAGTHLATAGSGLTDALQAEPDGIGSLAPTNGRIPLARLAGLSDALTRADHEAAAALAAIEGSPGSFLAAPVAEARWDAQDKAVQAADALASADDLVRGLPSFAGADKPTRYILMAENPAELRGTGGLWGAYAIVTFRDGVPSFGPFDPVQFLPEFPPDELPSPSPDYRENYDQFGGAGAWVNLNMTPDFPSAARAALSLYEKGVGVKLDGVIAADPFVLESMLRLTGPVRVPKIGQEVTADNVVAFTTNEAYAHFDTNQERKEVLGAVASGVFLRFLAMDGEGLARIQALGGAAGDGHLKIYSTDPTFERGLTRAGASGAFGAPGDVAAVIINNGAGNKVDYYVTRHVAYDVTLGGDGEAIATTEVTLDNDAPPNGPSYVVGPNEHVKHGEPGDLTPLLTVSCHDPCQLLQARRDGQDIEVAYGSELGIPWFREYRTIPALSSGTLQLVTRTSGAWEGNSSSGTYHLTMFGQTTIRPSPTTITVHAPEGTSIVWTNEPMTIDGNSATWTGDAPTRLDLVVHFEAGWPLRWIRNVARPFFS